MLNAMDFVKIVAAINVADLNPAGVARLACSLNTLYRKDLAGVEITVVDGIATLSASSKAATPNSLSGAGHGDAVLESAT